MFEPIIVDKNVDLNTQHRELAEPQLELPLPETRSTQDNWSHEQLELPQNAPQLPDTPSMYREIESYMAQAEMEQTSGTSETPSRLAPPAMPSIGNVAIEKIQERSSCNINNSENSSGRVNSGGSRLDVPDTRDTKREIRFAHSSDDPSGILDHGVKALDEVAAYSHLSTEMLQSMTEQHRRERDFRESQLNLHRKQCADLAEDHRRLVSLEGAFEIGRESLGDINI